MQVQLSRSDLEVLRQQAMESLQLDDEGESFVEEALIRLDDEDIFAIEDVGVEIGQFLTSVFAAWNNDEHDDVVEVLGLMLEDLDIELDYDEVDDDPEHTEGWSDVEEIDDEEGEEFAGY